MIAIIDTKTDTIVSTQGKGRIVWPDGAVTFGPADGLTHGIWRAAETVKDPAPAFDSLTQKLVKQDLKLVGGVPTIEYAVQALSQSEKDAAAAKKAKEYARNRRPAYIEAVKVLKGDPEADEFDVIGYTLDTLIFGTAKEKADLQAALQKVKTDIPKA